MLDFEKYKLPEDSDFERFITPPFHPKMPKGTDPELFRIYANQLEEYNKKKEERNEYFLKRQDKQYGLEEQFKIDLFDDLDICDNTKRHKLYSIAWDIGHASGLHEVYDNAEKLVELIR